MKNYDIAFEHYRGQHRYIVTHPEYSGALVVAAPDEVSAIVAAAEQWQTRWQSFEFYAYCKVGIYNRKKSGVNLRYENRTSDKAIGKRER